MVVGEVSILDVPPLKGNPFDTRPIERSRAHEMIGNETTLSTWREHMHSQSPRMMLLVGDRGSGRTSLINALSSQTNKHFVGYYWNNDDPVRRFLSELSVTFCGHGVPNSMHQTIETLIETLDSYKGALPLIAIDYPSDIEISSLLAPASPILQRLRAFVVVALTNSQFSSLDDGIKELFHAPEHLSPLSEGQIQSLCDSRIRRMSRERWHIHSKLLGAIHSRTGGNPREVLILLRGLLDEKRGLGSEGSLESLVKWERPLPSPNPDTVIVVEEPALSDWQEDVAITEELEEDEAEWDVEPEDLWDEEPEVGAYEEDSMTPAESTKNPPSEIEQETPDPSRITDWTPESGSILTMEEGTEPPRSAVRSGGFSGLLHRSVNASDNMDTGPDSTPVMDSTQLMGLADSEPETTKENPPETIEIPKSSRIASIEPEPPDYLGVLSTEGEQWTVDSGLEGTLPDPSEDSAENTAIQEEIEETGSNEPEFAINNTESTTTPDLLGPRWDSSDSLDESHLSAMNDAERLVVSIASEREISPSDAEIQARLEVGRPRLSQIYNALYRSGILSVRKQGRSRMFKLSDRASELLS
jgi:hypothetical protein